MEVKEQIMTEGIDMKEPRLEDCADNFRDADGAAFVVHCPKCGRENYALAVASGQCVWCGWTAQKEQSA